MPPTGPPSPSWGQSTCPTIASLLSPALHLPPVPPTSCLSFAAPDFLWSVAGTLHAYPTPSSMLLMTLPMTPSWTSAPPGQSPCRTFPTPRYPPPFSAASLPVVPRLSALYSCSRRSPANCCLFGPGYYELYFYCSDFLLQIYLLLVLNNIQSYSTTITHCYVLVIYSLIQLNIIIYSLIWLNSYCYLQVSISPLSGPSPYCVSWWKRLPDNPDFARNTRGGVYTPMFPIGS